MKSNFFNVILTLCISFFYTLDTQAQSTYCASGPTSNGYSTIDFVQLIGDSDSISNNTLGFCDAYEDYTPHPSQPSNLVSGLNCIIPNGEEEPG